MRLNGEEDSSLRLVGGMDKRRIVSFTDLDVYQRTYQASLVVMKEVLPRLPDCEKFDLKDQMSRACKAIPRLIGEGFAKRQQTRGFQKYIEDSMGECNEMIVCLSHCKDLYSRYVETRLCEDLIKTYDIAGKQLFRLGESWSAFKTSRPNPNPSTKPTSSP